MSSDAINLDLYLLNKSCACILQRVCSEVFTNVKHLGCICNIGEDMSL